MGTSEDAGAQALDMHIVQSVNAAARGPTDGHCPPPTPGPSEGLMPSADRTWNRHFMPVVIVADDFHLDEKVCIRSADASRHAEPGRSTPRRMDMRPIPGVLLTVGVVALAAGCSHQSVQGEQRLVEVHGDRAYLCLSDAVNSSDPPSCGADIGSSDNPELNGRQVAELVSVLAGRSQNVEITAEERDGKWFLRGFRAPQ